MKPLLGCSRSNRRATRLLFRIGGILRPPARRYGAAFSSTGLISAPPWRGGQT